MTTPNRQRSHAMSALRVLSPLVLLMLTSSTLFADEPIWTETFTDGVGRFNITTGHAEKVFVHDPADQNIDATFIRRDVNSEPELDSRLTDLDGLVGETDVVTFRLLWTPVSEEFHGIAWPSIGFFHSASLDHVAGIRVTNGASGDRWVLRVPGLADTAVGGPQWQFGATYLLEFMIDGPSHMVHFSSHILIEAEFVLQNQADWAFPEATEYAFDTLGIRNFLDDQGIGSALVADIDDFSLLGLDCNGNEILDFLDIANEDSNDADENGIPDECECPADFDFNGAVGAFDLAVLLGSWGPCPEPPADCPADIHGQGDGIV